MSKKRVVVIGDVGGWRGDMFYERVGGWYDMVCYMGRAFGIRKGEGEVMEK